MDTVMDTVQVSSLRDPDACSLAARLMRAGRPVGVYGRSVASIWVDPTSEEAIRAVYRIKGARRTGMPLGMVLDRNDLPALIDPDQIAQELRPLLLDPTDLAARLSTLVWIRFPLRQTAAARLPACLVSTAPDGGQWGQAWITDAGDAHSILAAQLAKNGVRISAPTSMNVSGEPEIVAAKDGADFCARHGIPLFLHDPNDGQAVQGSYPIIEVNRRGVRLVREGQFAAHLLSCLLGGIDLELDGYRPAKYPLLPMAVLGATDELPAYQLHDALQHALNRQRQGARPAEGSGS